jgi:KDO2-lipid IV(A) lauroyltransferase
MYDPARRSLGRRILDRAVGLAAAALFGLLRLLGPDRASALCGTVARAIGPRLRASRTARDNLRRAMPELDAAARERVVREVWDNLGRVVGELPHLRELSRTRVEIVGDEILDRIRASGRSLIFFTAHTGNWELSPHLLRMRGIDINVVYRTINNPHVDALVASHRAAASAGAIAKGAAGAREAIRVLKSGGHMGMLLDQRMSDGIAVPFFGIEAMTPSAPASLALRHGAVLVPAHIVRLDGARFRVVVGEPLDIAATGDRHADMYRIMAAANAEMERWIREAPGQWLWLHRRWPKP